MATKALVELALEEGRGILHLLPTWVPRAYCRPGRRLKLHPQDLYPFGLDRGAVGERWLSSAVSADNGPSAAPNEGLSYVVTKKGEKVLLRDVVEFAKQQVIGERLYKKYGRWPSFSKFFDNSGPLAFHLHQQEQHARQVGQETKPEMYYFPTQMNATYGEYPFTFFGLNPETTKDEVKECMRRFKSGDNNILALSRCYKLELDTGWDVPPGILHAPGSLCTYEPQFASDIAAMYQSIVYYEQKLSEDNINMNIPEEHHGDMDYLIELLDWERNVDPQFHQNRFMRPIPTVAQQDVAGCGYQDEWICYKSAVASAKKLTVLPGQRVVVKDAAAYGAICIQGYGQFGVWNMHSPTLIRYGQETDDEFFVTEGAAKEGVTIVNLSDNEELVILKQFAQNPERDGLSLQA